jgi:Dioxygenase
MTSCHDHKGGLTFDIATMPSQRLLDRRRALQVVAGAGLAALVGCGSGDDGEPTAASPTSTAGGSSTTPGAPSAAGSDAECSEIPEETAGPFPGDGSNGPDVLAEDGIVRADIRPSFGPASGLAEGVPAVLDLQVLDGANGCTPLTGAAVYVWHCDRDGLYSLYSPGATDQNYLRGVQETDARGGVSFTTIFPGCYAGRWPHVHFEVYPSLEDATGGGDCRGDLPAGDPGGCLQPGLRRRRLRPERHQPGVADARIRPGVRRWDGPPARHCDRQHR